MQQADGNGILLVLASEGSQASIRTSEVSFAGRNDPGLGERRIVCAHGELRRLQVQIQVPMASGAVQLEFLVTETLELALPDPEVLERRERLERAPTVRP